MSVLPAFAAFAQAPELPDPVRVELLDGGGGIGWSHLLTVAGAVIAVLVAGWINRSLARAQARREDARETRRAEREDEMDQRREQRERALELERELRAINGAKRQAIGALRMTRSALVESLTVLLASLDTGYSFNPDKFRLRPTLRAEDEHQMAMWMDHQPWGVLSTSLSLLDSLDVRNALVHTAPRGVSVAEDQAQVRGELRDAYEDMVAVIRAVESEVIRLQAEIGEPTVAWPPLPVPEQRGQDQDDLGST